MELEDTFVRSSPPTLFSACQRVRTEDRQRASAENPVISQKVKK
jgi:hypothetical protein